jgi:type IV secretory pathway VirB10-like protein
MEDFGYQKDEEQVKFSGSVKKYFLIAATLFSVACFIYITINAYYYVYQDNEGSIETIKSPEGPIKVIEEAPQVENSAEAKIDRSIYEDIFGNKKTQAKPKDAKLRTVAEPAIPPKKPVETENKIAAKEAAPIVTAPAAPQPQQKIIVYDDGAKKEAPAQDLLTKQKGEQKPAAQAASTPKKRAVRVQVAAMTSKVAANEYWNNLNHFYGDLFSGLKPFTEEVNLGKRGLFYRLQVGNFFNQIEAEEFCNRYIAQAKKSRADCIVVE